VIVDGRGVIITNNHVVQNAGTITVTLNDRRSFKAKAAGHRPLLRHRSLEDRSDRNPAYGAVGRLDAAQVGDIVLAIGSPFGLTSTVTQGIISAKERRDLGISPSKTFCKPTPASTPATAAALWSISAASWSASTRRFCRAPAAIRASA
jgi:S1-C subfamily serine protease